MDIPEDEWVHLFIHTLDTVPRNWYTETELRRGTITWPVMIDSFLLTFTFESEYPSIDQALKIIKTKMFDDCILPVYAQPDWAIQLEHALECYNFAEEPGDEDENPRSINIPESKGTRKVEGPKLEIPAITEPINIKNINIIGIETEPKFASIGDYWDDEMVGHIADLLHDYQDLFPTNFIEMKGIVGDLGVMRIKFERGC